MSLYYTLDEFASQIVTELSNVDNYLQMLNAIISREQQALRRGDDVITLESDITTMMIDADKVIEDVESNLNSIDLSKYALEIRAGFGGYSLGSIINAADAQPPTTWTLLSRHRDGSLFAAFGTLLVVGDIVEIFGVGDTDYEGFFTVTARSTDLFSVEEAEHLISGATVDPIYNVVTRLRER